MIYTLGQAMGGAKGKASVSTFQPAESKAEGTMVEKLEWACPQIKWYRQVIVVTPFATFHADASCLVREGYALAFECDGGPYHQDPLRDFCRDCLILQAGRVAKVYRMPAWCFDPRSLRWLDCLVSLSRCEPDLMDPGRLEVIRGVEAGITQWEMLPLERRGSQLVWTSLQANGVQEFLAFASGRKGTFPNLVEDYRRKID